MSDSHITLRITNLIKTNCLAKENDLDKNINYLLEYIKDHPNSLFNTQIFDNKEKYLEYHYETEEDDETDNSNSSHNSEISLSDSENSYVIESNDESLETNHSPLSSSTTKVFDTNDTSDEIMDDISNLIDKIKQQKWHNSIK